MDLEKEQLASTVAALQAKIGTLVRSIGLMDIRMLRGFCNLAIPLQPKLPPQLNQSINIATRAMPESKLPPHTGVTITFSLFGNYENGDEALRVEATFCLIYTVDWINEPTQEDTDALGQAIGVNNAWPYWREFVQSMTGRMAIPPVRIPILRMDQLAFTQSKPGKKRAIEGSRRKKTSSKRLKKS